MPKLKPYVRKANYYETDKMAIVHHSNYVRFLEEARIDMLSQAGYPFDRMEAEGVWIPVLSVECSYKYPIRFGDEFEVRPTVTLFNGCKLELSYEIINITAGGKLSAEAKTKHCLTDVNMRPIRSQKTHPEIYRVFAGAVKNEANEHTKLIKINWNKSLTIDDAIESELSNKQGLYYITRIWGGKETSLYVGIATKDNTIRKRLKQHTTWTSLYRGEIHVRIGEVVYPQTITDSIIDHAESAVVYEHNKILIENTAKTKSYSYDEVYKIENTGDIFELKPIIDMNEH